MTAETLTAADATRLADAYLAIWNERDGGARRALIEATWTADGLYLDPLLRGEGRDGIDAALAGAQPLFPGLHFRRTSEVDVHNDRLRFSWALGPEGESPAMAGIDWTGGRWPAAEHHRLLRHLAGNGVILAI